MKLILKDDGNGAKVLYNKCGANKTREHYHM